MVRRNIGNDITGFNRLGGINLTANPLDSGLATRGPNTFKGMQTIAAGNSTTDTALLVTNGSIRTRTSSSTLFSNTRFTNADPSTSVIPTSASFGNYALAANNFYGMGLGVIRNGFYDTWWTNGNVDGGGYRWYKGITELGSLTYNGEWLQGTSTRVPQSIATWTSTTQGILPPRLTRTQAVSVFGSVNTGTIVNAGSGGTNGTYNGTLTSNVSSSGISLYLNITIAGGVVSAATILLQGTGYAVGDTVTVSAGSISGFRYVITSIGVAGLMAYNTTSSSFNFANGVNRVGDFISSSASTLTLFHGVDYAFTGTTSTWTLPPINSAVLGRQNSIQIRNRGSGAITLNSNTGSTIYTTVAVGAITINPGVTVELTPDGTYFKTNKFDEEINSTVSAYTNFTTTATYQNITSITLTAGDWDLSAFYTYSSNSATITAAANAIFVISTTTASASGATEGKNISYVPQAALLGTSFFSDAISPYRVSPTTTTTYYLNAQAAFTVGNPQYVGSIRAVRAK